MAISHNNHTVLSVHRNNNNNNNNTQVVTNFTYRNFLISLYNDQETYSMMNIMCMSRVRALRL